MTKNKLRERLIAIFEKECDGTFSSHDPKTWTLNLSADNETNVSDFIETLVNEIQSVE